MESWHLLTVKEWHRTAFAIFLIFFVNILKHTDPRSMIHVNSVRWLQKDRKVNFQLCFYCTLIYSLSYCTLYNTCTMLAIDVDHSCAERHMPVWLTVYLHCTLFFCFGDLLGLKLFLLIMFNFVYFFASLAESIPSMHISLLF